MTDVDAAKRAAKMSDYYAAVSNNMTDRENDAVFSLSSTINTTTGIYLALVLGILGDPEKARMIQAESILILCASLFLLTVSLLIGIAWHIGSKNFFHSLAKASGDLSNSLDKVHTSKELIELNDGQFRRYKEKPQRYGRGLLWLQILLFVAGIFLSIIYILSRIDSWSQILTWLETAIVYIKNIRIFLITIIL